VPTPGFLQNDRWLPSTSTSHVPNGGSDTVERRPVYRGLFWLVGMRVSCTVKDDARFLRLRLIVVGPDGASAVVEGAPAAAGSRTLGVEAFAPTGWRSWRLEGVDRAGKAHRIRSESTVVKDLALVPHG
jgi:hypothetical protein